MRHDSDKPDETRQQAARIAFYVLATVSSAVVAMTIRVESLGLFFSVGALFPLSFFLCLVSPNGPLRMGIAIFAGMIVGWSILNPVGGFVMLIFGVVFVNAILILTGALFGSLLRKAVMRGEESALTEDQSDPGKTNTDESQSKGGGPR